jgi:hypothetical protein
MPIRFLLAAAFVGLACNTGTATAAVLTYETVLSGAAEAPSNASPGTGNATLTVDTAARTFLLAFSFSNLVGTTTAAHIHGPTATPGTGTAGVMTQTPYFVGFPIGVTSGSYSRQFDLTDTATYNASFVTGQGGVAGAEATFLAALAAGTAYLNIHSTVYGGGEIRGFFAETAPVPLPAGAVLSLSALAILGAAGALRRRRS